MKTNQLILIILVLSALAYTGCRKSTDNPTPSKPSTLTELKASSKFSWSTGTPITVSIQGLPTVIPVKSTLSISLKDGSVLYSALHEMDRNLTLSLMIPTIENGLVLKYGSASYQVPVVSNSVTFSFIPVLDDNQ
ncbi:MAG: hypothetical protein ACOYNC_03705 [Bacteroidales bacterium]